MMRSRALLYALIGGCSATTPRVTSSSTSAQASSQLLRPQITADGTCISVAVIENGSEKGAICASAALARGLTIVDLTDTWTPTLLAPADGQVPSFHDRYLQLANERDPQDHPIEGEDALDELYGVVPALAIVSSRLADDQRHACHAAIDPKPILALDKTLSQDNKQDVAIAEQSRVALAGTSSQHCRTPAGIA